MIAPRSLGINGALTTPIADYRYYSDAQGCAHEYILPIVEEIVARRRPASIFDLGCGNGSVADRLSRFAPVAGIDASASGVLIANQRFPKLKIAVGSVYDDLPAQYGSFPVVVSLEVVEHLYDPRLYARNLFGLVEPGGIAIVSTPFHGYWKNLALALSGRFDNHFTALWDGGHVKFWSVRTLTTLLEEAGFQGVEFRFAGRISALAKSMLAIARKP